ncbi:helix-turn-helix domain-containing protein [Pseudonocardia kongjuensis]|uniref:Helix-turn-helix domain-containing protein n=1 Tax=Pseudonocardia kongjuensis TaxID=102227 RepID=A0ABP4ICH5_9PSEU
MDTEDAWARMVARLRRRVPELATAFLARLDRDGHYDDQPVTPADLRDTAEESLALLVDQLARTDGRIELGDLPDRLGRHRARQGVDLDDLVRAVRLDFPVLWSALLDQDGDAAVLVRRADRVWAVVDAYAREVHFAFLDEQAVLAEQQRDEQRQLLDLLFRGGPGGTPAEHRTARLAAGLGVGEDAAFTVCAALADHAATLRGRAARTAGVHLRDVEFGVVAFWPADVPGAAPPEHRLTADIGCVVVGGVAGLAAVPDAASAALRMAHLLPPDAAAPHGPREVWPLVARRALDDHGGLAGTLLAGLDAARPDETGLLRETALAYLDSGSVATVAGRLYCHRNTVLNRLRRFAALTGLDLTRPRDAALAVVLLSG